MVASDYGGLKETEVTRLERQTETLWNDVQV